jgi:hypothetical protein
VAIDRYFEAGAIGCGDMEVKVETRAGTLSGTWIVDGPNTWSKMSPRRCLARLTYRTTFG